MNLILGHTGSPELSEELIAHVGKEISPIAKPEKVTCAGQRPFLRRSSRVFEGSALTCGPGHAGIPPQVIPSLSRDLPKARALGLPEGDISTLEE